MKTLWKASDYLLKMDGPQGLLFVYGLSIHSAKCLGFTIKLLCSYIIEAGEGAVRLKIKCEIHICSIHVSSISLKVIYSAVGKNSVHQSFMV